ncbi:AdoMet-dependent rRNA methyltransferase spb1 [Polyrhizophydium stewartii]|uniref:AdoMet-dependent rRNA methyltransferase spb1 n=1 Tax=Polyrhizophydium stewartii TaxID=2732419 RepID=A0ABR4NE92_9FUNG
MAREKKYAKGRLDKYYHMAKEQGYRARSAFKLIQLNKKYGFLEKAKVLVDLLQVAAKHMPKPSIIIGLDLAPIKPIPGVITHVEDITTSKCRQTIKSELKTWKVDVFLHDGAPNVGTSWLQDAFTQSELTLSALKLATEFLMPNGTFVTKVFRSKDYNKLIWVFQQLFNKVEATKPASSRNVSAEIFVVCREYKAPKKIDPRLLDPKWAFKEIDDTKDEEEEDEKAIKEKQGAILNTLFHPEKRRRFRDGYEDGDYTLHTVSSVSSFIHSIDFLGIMARSNELHFEDDEVSKTILASPLTTDDIKEFLKDLKVLGKKEFRQLIKWRESIRAVLGLETRASVRAKKADAAKAAAEAAAQAEEDEDIEEKMLREREQQEQRERRTKKKQRERKAKLLLKLQLGMATPTDIGVDANKDVELMPEFEVGDTSDPKRAAKAVRAAEAAAARSDDEDAEDADGDEDDNDAALDSDEERERHLSRLEKEMDHMYEEFQARLAERNPSAKARKKREGLRAEFDEWYGVEYEKKAGLGDAAEGEVGANSDSDSDSDSDASMHDEDAGVTSRKRRSADADEDEDDEDDDEADAPMSKKARVFFDNPVFSMLKDTKGKPKENGANKPKSAFDDEMQLDSDDDADEHATAESKKKAKKAKKSKQEMLAAFGDDEDGGSKSGGKGDFAVVPVSRDDDDGEADDDFIIDTAQKYTLAQSMISKSGSRDAADDAYNRYAFGDRDGLPAWFLEDEGKHNKPSMPVTKEAAEIIRQRMRALDARPIKKVAEAKFRKQMRAQRRLEKVAKKAEGMNEEEDVPEKSKLEAISKLMSKAKSKKERAKPKLVVAKGANRGAKGRPRGVKGRYKMVDGRMRKDVQAMKRAQQKRKGRR